ncbi:tRNA 2'-phosphotransferase 1 [Drosophila busckii]|nr:tRNA 2'-phosphotransferase 1 [Drosophila busckii]
MYQNSNDLQLSKQLLWLLRHGAQSEGFRIQADGFVCVADILQHPRFAGKYNVAKLSELVEKDAKQRYTLRCNPATNELEIRANQGHSMEVVKTEACLARIESMNELAGVAVVHGTYYKHWGAIQKEGLKRMTRNHIHFALLPNDGAKVLSGFRSNCQLLIYLNVPQLLADNIPLYRSSNNVILCEGLNGVISSKYFKNVYDKRSGKCLS